MLRDSIYKAQKGHVLFFIWLVSADGEKYKVFLYHAKWLR